MEELHKSPISFHGNLKSTNIVVDGYWICKIADFGLKSLKPPDSHVPLLEEESKYAGKHGGCKLTELWENVVNLSCYHTQKCLLDTVTSVANSTV